MNLQQRRPTATSDEPQQQLALLLVELVHDLPEDLDRELIVVVQTTVIRVRAQVVEVDGRVRAADEDLDFLLIEHPARGVVSVMVDEAMPVKIDEVMLWSTRG